MTKSVIALPPELRSETTVCGLTVEFAKGGFHLFFLKSIVIITQIKCVILCHIEITES